MITIFLRLNPGQNLLYNNGELNIDLKFYYATFSQQHTYETVCMVIRKYLKKILESASYRTLIQYATLECNCVCMFYEISNKDKHERK